ncbi:hypothetical protein [Mycobacterium spongiae]|nr:hypothetical protein [Mycobacterium spongiae]
MNTKPQENTTVITTLVTATGVLLGGWPYAHLGVVHRKSEDG